tara:strand:- start:758 stop:1192 length:435 start_codon:yes stop_codon:yes gene_type:complete
MGTRSLTKVIETWKNKKGKKQRRPITTMYRQFDGYMSGHGLELAEWLSQYTVVNGIRINETRKIANGIDCLAAQMFAHFKDGAGDIYCMHPDAEDCWEDYLYEISEVDKEIFLTVYEIWKDTTQELFHGTPEELLTKITVNEEI